MEACNLVLAGAGLSGRMIQKTRSQKQLLQDPMADD